MSTASAEQLDERHEQVEVTVRTRLGASHPFHPRLDELAAQVVFTVMRTQRVGSQQTGEPPALSCFAEGRHIWARSPSTRLTVLC